VKVDGHSSFELGKQAFDDREAEGAFAVQDNVPPFSAVSACLVDIANSFRTVAAEFPTLSTVFPSCSSDASKCLAPVLQLAGVAHIDLAAIRRLLFMVH
jgi:hypothetical protein